jgi:hypothetical protein
MGTSKPSVLAAIINNLFEGRAAIINNLFEGRAAIKAARA